MDSPSILPICKEFYLRVDAILLGVGAIVQARESCICPAHLGSTHHLLDEGRGHSDVSCDAFCAHITRGARKLARAVMGANLEVGREVGALRHLPYGLDLARLPS